MLEKSIETPLYWGIIPHRGGDPQGLITPVSLYIVYIIVDILYIYVGQFKNIALEKMEKKMVHIFMKLWYIVSWQLVSNISMKINWITIDGTRIPSKSTNKWCILLSLLKRILLRNKKYIDVCQWEECFPQMTMVIEKTSPKQKTLTKGKQYKGPKMNSSSQNILKYAPNNKQIRNRKNYGL
jgi:hypothetical protein